MRDEQLRNARVPQHARHVQRRVLVRIQRENIAPSGGNNDNVVTPLCNLLLHANRIVEDTGSDADWSVDVMDYIYNEMYEAMTGDEVREQTDPLMCESSFLRHLLRLGMPIS